MYTTKNGATVNRNTASKTTSTVRSCLRMTYEMPFTKSRMGWVSCTSIRSGLISGSILMYQAEIKNEMAFRTTAPKKHQVGDMA